MGTGVLNYPANIIQDVAGCHIDYIHEIWDENLQSFVDFTKANQDWLVADPANGAFDINQADDPAFRPA